MSVSSDCSQGWPDDVLKADKEIQKACGLSSKMFEKRFPKSEVLDALRALFSAQAKPAAMDQSKKSANLAIVANDWAQDVKEAGEEYSAYSTYVLDATREGYSGKALLEHVAVAYGNANPQSPLSRPMHFNITPRGQNGTLERDFSYKRLNENRTASQMAAECLTERLHVQLTKKSPETMKVVGGQEGKDDFDPLIRGAAHDATHQVGPSPAKRQLSLDALVDLGGYRATVAVSGVKTKMANTSTMATSTKTNI